MDMEFNINHDVWVKLTDNGREVLRKQHEELNRLLNQERDYTPVTEDNDGWSRWQLWTLMDELGPFQCMMGPHAFETVIRFASKDFKTPTP